MVEHFVFNPNFWIAMTFASVANGCAFLIFARLSRLGHGRGLWSWNDVRLYRLYWNLAPQQGWSRFPLLLGVSAFVLAGVFLFRTV